MNVLRQGEGVLSRREVTFTPREPRPLRRPIVTGRKRVIAGVDPALFVEG